MTDNDDELRALLALAAVDALDPDEERALYDALADRPDLAAELDELRGAAATMATAVAETPPPSVRAGVLAAIAAEAAAPASPASPSPPVVTPLAPRRQRRLLLAAAAAIVVVASAAIATRVLDDSSADDIAAVLDDADAVSVELHGEIGDLTVVYSDDEGRAVMQGDGIAVPDGGKVYELWTQPAGSEAMVSVGTFRPDGDGVVETLMDGIALVPTDLFAVTVEPSGGSEVPTLPTVADST